MATAKMCRELKQFFCFAPPSVYQTKKAANMLNAPLKTKAQQEMK
jgi:hypothetical protein